MNKFMKKNFLAKIVTIFVLIAMVLAVIPTNVFADTETLTALQAEITLPVDGNHPDSIGTPGDSSKYTVDDVNFYDEGTLLTSSDTFVGGKTYTIYVLLTPQSGKEISNSAAVTINGQAASYWSTISNGYGSKMFYIDYVAPTSVTQITEVSATVPTPVAGEHPSFTATPGNADAYTAIVYGWYDLDNNGAHMSASDTFAVGHEYQVRIHFTAKSGYTFANSMDYTINGMPNYTAFETAYQRGMDFTVADAILLTTHQVTFNLDNGTMTGTNPVTVNHGEKVTRPVNDPVRENYVFINWYADSDKTELFDFNTPIEGPTTIYAKWDQYASVAIGTTAGGTYSISNTDAYNESGAMNLVFLASNNPVTFTATPASGYHFVGWYRGVINGETHFVDNHTLDLISSNASFTTSVNSLIIMAVFAEDEPNSQDPTDPDPNDPGTVTYTIVSGGNQTYYKGSNTDIVITASGAANKLQGIEIDNGNPIDPANYEIASGSTILTLKAAFLENSSLGAHTITFKYDDGEVETTLTVAEATNNGTSDPDPNGDDNGNTGTGNAGTGTGGNATNNPNTLDNIVIYILMLGLSIVGITSVGLYFKKKFD